MYLTLISCDPVLDIGIDFSASKDAVYIFCPGRGDNCVDTTIYFSRERLNPVKLSRAGNGHYSAFYSIGPGTLSSWFLSKWNADTVSFFLFDKEAVDSSTWETIVEEYMVLQRYDVTKKDLERLNCVLYYPPTEEMKTIRMYPRYEVK